MIEITIPVSGRLIADQMVTAFESGFSSWLHRVSKLSSAEPTERPWYSCPKLWEQPFEVKFNFDDPNKREGNGSGIKFISNADLALGLKTMAEKAPTHFGDMLAENVDAVTADVFLQMILFGEIIYG